MLVLRAGQNQKRFNNVAGEKRSILASTVDGGSTLASNTGGKTLCFGTHYSDIAEGVMYRRVNEHVARSGVSVAGGPRELMS